MTAFSSLNPGRALRRTWRTERKEHRKDLESLGRTPARRQFIFRIETEILAIPDWAFLKAVPDLESTRDYAWLEDRVLAHIIAKMDHENGGRPKVDRFEARRCHRCGMLRLGLLAQGRRKLDESSVDGRDLPCGPECTLRYHLQRGDLGQM